MKNLLYVFLIAILPIIELRGAVPVGAALGNDIFLNALAAILGNLLPVPFILLFIPKILDLMERVRFLAPIVRWVRRKADKHKGKILKDEADALPTEIADTPDGTAAKKRKRGAAAAFWGLMLFVLIPLPGTGAWTGALIAAMMDMRLKRAFPSIMLGVITAGVIVTVLTSVGLGAYIGFSA